MEKNYME